VRYSERYNGFPVVSLPVIGQDDRVVGMVSRNDLMTAIS
jgi:CBS domain-containing protein